MGLAAYQGYAQLGRNCILFSAECSWSNALQGRLELRDIVSFCVCSVLLSPVSGQETHHYDIPLVNLPHATEVLWYPNLFRGLLLVGDRSPGFPSAKWRMCGVDEDLRSSPGLLLLEERLFLFE